MEKESFSFNVFQELQFFYQLGGLKSKETFARQTNKQVSKYGGE